MAEKNEILTLLTSQNPAGLAQLTEEFHPADILEVVQDQKDYSLLQALPDSFIADILDEAEDEDKYEILKSFNRERTHSILNQMSVDEVTDLIEALEEDNREAVIAALGFRNQNDVKKLLAYESDTAGGIMTTRFIAIYASNTVMGALNYLKTDVDAETGYYMYVVDKYDFTLKGVVSLRDLVMAPFDTPIGDLLNPHVISVHVEDDQEKVAQVFSRYGYQAIPVVDGDNRLVGIITVDDVIDVLNEEFTEDLHHLAGIGKEEKVDGSVADSVKSRLPWLAVNLVTALAASFVINLFNGTIEKIVALSAVMTIISGMGGNAGTQTLTLVIRALSLEEIDRENARPILLKELGVGLINGAAIGVLVAGIAMFYDANPLFGLIAGLAMVLNMLCAAAAGYGVPILLEKLGIDPALASGVFVTTVTDCMGFLIFLGLATAAMPLLV